jgi:hypothetical protein
MNITPDALPLPGPTWLFEFLLHFTFVLHLLAMNFLVGGAMIAIVSRLRGAMDLARWIETKLPATMAFTVTLGVAPLLFVQALYGHLFYTSSVLMAWPWFSVLLILLVTYALVYRVAWHGESGAAKLLLLVINLGLLAIGFLYVNNMTLALRPDTWAAKYLARPDGTSLNTGDPTFWPRYLHFMIAALAVTGMVLATVGAKRIKNGDEGGRSWLQTGAFWFVVPTALQIVTGLWWLIALPKPVMEPLMGGNTAQTMVFMISITLPLFALIMMALSIKLDRPFGIVHGASWLLVLTIVGMVLTRQYVREGMLEGHFDTASIQTIPQWDVFGLFAVLLVIALGTVFWMLREMARAKPA